MKGSALFLIGLIVASNAFTTDLFSKHHPNAAPMRNIMDVMVQVEASVKSGGPADSIQNIFDGFKNGVNSEQIRHDDLYSGQKNECDSEIGFRNKEVQDASLVLRDAGAQLKRCQVQKGKAGVELQTTSDQLIQYTQHIELIQQVRRAQQENFSRAAVVFHEAIRALEDSVDLAQQIQNGGASFAQLADQSGLMMKQAMSLGKTAAYGAVLASMAKLSLAQQVDSADVDRLVNLLNTLSETLKDSNAEWVEENNKSIALFVAQKERLEGNIVRLQAAEVALNKQISELASCIAQQTAVTQQASNKRGRNQKLLDDATALCSVFDQEYNAATVGRRQELLVLAELERIAAKKYAPQ